MKLLLARRPVINETTIGDLFIEGTWECVTLEDKDRQLEDGNEKVYGKSAIPRGTYDLILDVSARFKLVMPHILNVPGFLGVRIHSGNTVKDTDGCVIVGRKASLETIFESRVAYQELFKKLESCKEKITIEIV